MQFELQKHKDAIKQTKKENMNLEKQIEDNKIKMEENDMKMKMQENNLNNLKKHIESIAVLLKEK